MKKLAIYFKHCLIVNLALLAIGFAVLVSQNGSIGFGVDDLAFKVGNEGPHVFVTGDKVEALYIKGSRDEGFYVDRTPLVLGDNTLLPVFFPLDNSEFHVQLSASITTPEIHYDDGEPIIAVSDIEGNFKAFRDFLIKHNVVDEDLHWQFGKGHLVLVGDIVDRGFSTTPLLWLIYKLEQEAKKHGGHVHYIIGNHEIKNLQGNFRSAATKYLPISGILGKQQHELFGSDSLLGQWLASKNVIERINQHLFVHGGLHPELMEHNLTLDTINQIVRQNYRQYYYPNNDYLEEEKLLVSNRTGPAWYRGFFKDELNQQQIAHVLDKFESRAVIVGHTVQRKVNKQYEGLVFAIDVKHPEDYSFNIPIKRSEGLLITNNQYYRLLEDGTREIL